MTVLSPCRIGICWECCTFFRPDRKKIICTSSHGKLHYAAFGLDKKQYLCVSARDARGEEVIRLFRREKRDFVPVL